MLERLSGRTHEVLTAVALAAHERARVSTERQRGALSHTDAAPSACAYWDTR